MTFNFKVFYYFSVFFRSINHFIADLWITDRFRFANPISPFLSKAMGQN